MPQFDTLTFFNQLFYFTIVFFCFYFFILGTVIPKISIVLKARNKKLNKDNFIVNLLKNESNSVLIAYDELFLKTTSNFVNRSCMEFWPDIVGMDDANWVVKGPDGLHYISYFPSIQKALGELYLKSLIKLFINY